MLLGRFDSTSSMVFIKEEHGFVADFNWVRGNVSENVLISRKPYML
jgi:hypothetical protein